jgi:aminoglycoside phosphotransferase (APT) family kinase protein
MHRFFEDVATGHGLPGMPHFLRRADVAATFAELTGYAPRDLEFFEIYAALRYAIVMFRILRRAIHFGEVAMPDDVDDMLMNRPLLERMLADAGAG